MANLRAASVFLLGAVVVSGCGAAPKTLHPTVVVDGSFALDDAAGVHAALAAWELAAPEIRFGVVQQSRADALRGARAPADDTIYLLRVDADTDPACPHAITPGAAGETLEGVICLVAPRMGTLSKHVAMHELGHAIDLPHRSYPSCMTAVIAPDIEAPTDGDVALLRQRWAGHT